MATMIRPQSMYDDKQPIEFAPFFNMRSGEFDYWKRLDTSRVEQDSFTFISGAVYVKERNTKLKLKLSIDVSMKPMPELGNITTYAVNNKTKAFGRQLKNVYGTGRRADIPYYCWHQNKVKEFLEKNQGYELEVQTGIPVSSGNKGNPLTAEMMKDAFVSLVENNGEVAACIISIGRFSKAYLFDNFDHARVKNSKVKKDYPLKVFHDERDDLYEDDSDTY